MVHVGCLVVIALRVVVILLGVMTAKLLVAFLRCFDDEFAAVRAETCITCSRLRIRDDQVLTKLARLIRDDPIHRVKALAIQGFISSSLYYSYITPWIRGP